MGSVNNKEGSWYARQGMLLTIISFVVAIIAFGKESLFASIFGVSAQADAYTVAIQVPEIIFAIVWDSIHAIVIPLYSDKIYNEGKQKADSFLSTLLLSIILLAIAVVTVLEVFANQIIFLFSPGLPQAVHYLATELYRYVMPMVIFEAVIRVSIGVMNVHKQFILPKALGCIRNVVVIVFLLVFTSRFGILASIFGLLTGVVLESFVSFAATKRNVKYGVCFNYKDPSLRKALYMALPVAAGTGISDLNLLVDKMIASFLESGSIISLNYAGKLSGLVDRLILSNIGTLLYPEFSKLAAEANLQKMIEVFLKAIKISIIIGVPIIFGGFALNSEIVSVAFARGAFDKEAVPLVANLFFIYLGGSFFTTIRTLAVRAFMAIKDTKTPLYNSLIGIGVNIILNLILSHLLGAIGLAVASLISALIISSILLRQVSIKIAHVNYSELLVVSFKCVLSGLAMTLAVLGVKEILYLTNSTDSLFFSALLIIMGIVIGAIIYIAALKMLRVKELDFLFARLKKK